MPQLIQTHKTFNGSFKKRSHISSFDVNYL